MGSAGVDTRGPSARSGSFPFRAASKMTLGKARKARGHGHLAAEPFSPGWLGPSALAWAGGPGTGAVRVGRRGRPSFLWPMRGPPRRLERAWRHTPPPSAPSLTATSPPVTTATSSSPRGPATWWSAHAQLPRPFVPPSWRRFLEQGRTKKEREALFEEYAERPFVGGEDLDEHLDILREAVVARNGWRRILARCAEPSPRQRRTAAAASTAST